MGLSTRDLSETSGRTALVVIGMQRARLTGPDAPAATHRVSTLVSKARRDGTQVVFVQHDGPGCETGSDGWRMAEGLRPQFPDWVVEKAQFSIFDGTNLAAQLRAVGIERLVVTGPANADDVGVSCAAATALGFRAEIAEGAIGTGLGDQVARGAQTIECF